VDLDLSGRRHDDPVPGYARRLHPLRRLCAALAGAVVLFGVLSWVLVHQAGESLSAVPSAVPLALSLLAAVLILLSSRFRSNLLRRAFPRTAVLPVDSEAVLAAYGKATLLSFALLEAAALAGLLVALTSGSAAYGIVLCLASAFGMVTRWPRAAEVDRLIRRAAL
jgi:hypothetical protein